MKLARLIPALALMGLCITACGGSDASGVTLGKKIALLLPENQTARFENQDVPLFEAKIKSMCSDCTIDYRNAHQDAAAQLTQAESVLAGGAGVLVLDPVAPGAAEAIVAKAAARHVPVISYDQLVLDAPGLAYYVSFDRAAVGPLQANALLAALKGKAKPAVVMIAGDPADATAKRLQQDVLTIINGKVTLAKTYETPSSSAGAAQTEMSEALSALNGKVDAVYAVDDATAGGAATALKAAGVKPLPPITGGGAELPAIQRILVGDQYMTVYESIRTEAESAAQLAYDLVYGVSVPASMAGGRTVDNGSTSVPAVLVSPLAVTRPTIISTVIADRFWTSADICTSQYAQACAAAGIS